MLNEEIRSIAKQKMTRCRACKECNGIVCAGETPGSGGKGNGSSFITNVSKLKQVRLNMNVIASNDLVSTETDFFGKKVECPIYVAPIGNIEANYGAKMSEKEYTEALVTGCGKRTLVFSGDGQNIQVLTEPLSVMKDGFGVPTIKPWQKEELFKRIDLVKEAGFEVICSDIDAAGLISLKKGTPIAEFKDEIALKEMIDYAACPVIVKGIMSVSAALKACDAGAAGIVVSNHGGRVLQDTPATIEVLERIALAVQGRCKIFVDGGFRSGYDVFKALALGADGVLIGRPFSIAAIAMQDKGVDTYLTQLNHELKEAMAMCGCRTINDITRDCVDVEFLEGETMKAYENNAFFWQKLDTLYLSSQLVIDRPKKTCHYKYSNLIYPVDYGYLSDTTSTDASPIDVFKGSLKGSKIQAIIVSADILKKDCEVKLVVGCTEDEITDILSFLNQTEFQKAVLLRRGNEVPDWAITD